MNVTDRQTDDRQTDHATEKCMGIGGTACAARAIPPNIYQRLKNTNCDDDVSR